MMKYLVGARNPDGDVTLTRSVEIKKPTPNRMTFRLAIDRALEDWSRLGYDVREEDVQVLRVYR